MVRGVGERARPVIDSARLLDPQDRVPITLAHSLLDYVVNCTADTTLGLRAGSTLSLGEIGAADYAIRSAATVRAAFEVADRYMRLVNDALALQIDLDGARAVVRLESSIPLPAIAEDFLVCAFFHNHVRGMLAVAPELECWLKHQAPASTGEYEAAFAPARVRFSAPASGFAFDAACLDLPINSRDPKLHEMLCEHANGALAALTTAENVTTRVRALIGERLGSSAPTVNEVASQLRFSSRTLLRRLADEGTTYKALLDQERRQRALSLLDRGELSLAEIGRALGFSQVAAFHRAFKRWTGQTPLSYRRCPIGATRAPIEATFKA